MDCGLPTTIPAGLTFSRRYTLTAYPADDGWVLSVLMRGPSTINLTGTADGVQHVVSADAVTTEAWAPGVYAYSVRVAKGADKFEVDAGTVQVMADLAGVINGADMRSHAAKVLAAIEAVLEKRATLDQERYTINNRELWRTPIADLLKLRDVYRLEVRREQAAQCGKSLFGATVRVRLK